MEPSEGNAEGVQPAFTNTDEDTPAFRQPSSTDSTPPAGSREKLAETIRLTMLSLLGFALFSVLMVFSTSDTAFLVADPLAKLPYADLPVSFKLDFGHFSRNQRSGGTAAI